MNFASYYTRSAIRWVVFGQITVKLKRECSLFDFSARFSDANTLSQMFSSRLDHKGLDKWARIGGGVTVQPQRRAPWRLLTLRMNALDNPTTNLAQNIKLCG